tara:strand:+ start:106 stop:510 length:405 start_codon:yes stop_codon:yes gene_type:complete
MSVEEKLDVLIKAVEQIGFATKRAGLDDLQRRGLDRRCYEAIRYGHADKVKFFLEQGALTFRDDQGKYRTLFSYACEFGHLEVVKVFDKLGLTDKYHDDHGKTPMEYAVQKNRVDIIQYFERHPSLLNRRKVGC